MEKHKLVSQNGFMEFYTRELGSARPTIFPRRISASQALVERIDLYRKLIGHGGCVNTFSFNSTGDYLVSGSDDRRIIFWEWETKAMKFDYPSGHVDNVFDARIMPFTDDRKIVTCAADGKVNAPGFRCQCYPEIVPISLQWNPGGLTYYIAVAKMV